jgi:uncharacterized protein YegP (UPF0339 family)
MQGYYELRTTAADKPMFNLKAGNHEVILTSESYESRQAALDGIAAVRKHGRDSGAYEKKISTAGQPFFVLKATNGQVIGKSEMYSSERTCDQGIASVMRNCVSEKVVEAAPTPA